MKALTHYVFSTGSAFYVLSALGQRSAAWFLLALWLSLSVNFLIDLMGHGLRPGRPKRSLLTHSVATAPLWGAFIGASSAALYSPSAAIQLALWGAFGSFVAFTHLFLDSLTEGGVYLIRHRIAIAHFRYNNVLLNGGFLALGLALAILGLAS